MNPKEQAEAALAPLIIAGIDTVVDSLKDLAVASNSPEVAMAAGWATGWALTEKERLQRLVGADKKEETP